MSARQSRAARALLGWSQAKLAQKAGISLNAVTRLEQGKVDPRMSTVQKVRTALMKAGIDFLGDARFEGFRVRLG